MIVDQTNSEEVDHHRFVTEASALGIHPGQWPAMIQTTRGNKLPFIFDSEDVSHGELIARNYNQHFGCISLKVYND